MNLNLKNFDSKKLTNMDYIFYKCYSLSSLDLSMLETTNVKSMKFIFNYCTNLTKLNLEKFNTNNCDNFDAAFSGVNDINIIINKENNGKLLEKIYGDYSVVDK